MGFRPRIFEAAAEPGGWRAPGAGIPAAPGSFTGKSRHPAAGGGTIRLHSPITPEHTVSDLIVRDGYPRRLYECSAARNPSTSGCPGIETEGVVGAADLIERGGPRHGNRRHPPGSRGGRRRRQRGHRRGPDRPPERASRVILSCPGKPRRDAGLALGNWRRPRRKASK